MLVTTYQHDYLAPNTKRYDFLKTPKSDSMTTTKTEVECQCADLPMLQLPKDATDKCAEPEWTSIAPMGRLLNARIIPTKFPPNQVAKMAVADPSSDCMLQQPNRFLKILRTAYPDLYERLKQMPREELKRRINRDRMFTTYQIDYCDVNEYPEGVYDSIAPQDDTSKTSAGKLLQAQAPCSEFRANVLQELDKEVREGRFNADPCEKAYKPFKITFGDSSRFIASGGFSHWRTNAFTKRANFSEYMDTINKNGCVIMKNNIHDHSKCRRGAHCLHKLVETCANLKY